MGVQTKYESLSRLVLKTLDAQQVYYKLRRTPHAKPEEVCKALDESKANERRLRKEAEAALAPPTLFGDEDAP